MNPTPDSTNDWKAEVFYDGECPLCLREINFIRWLDGKNQLRFTDITDSEFSTNSVGIDMPTLMAEIHGRSPSGETIKGVEVFRQLYGNVSRGHLLFGPLTWASRAPGVSHLLDWCYLFFAKNRLKFTGRCNDATCEVPQAD